MPVSVLTGVAPEREQLVRLPTAFPTNPLVIEHFGGSEPGQPGWEEVLSLAKFDNVVVKCTATPGLAGAPSTPAGFGAATLELLGRFGASRLLWGSNFPHASTQEYVEIWGWFDRWCEEQLSEQERGMLAGGTAASLYAFGGLAAPSSGGESRL